MGRDGVGRCAEGRGRRNLHCHRHRALDALGLVVFWPRGVREAVIVAQQLPHLFPKVRCHR